jgi:putative DNA primase/helicase
VLAGEDWFCTLFKDLADQDARQNLRGKWIVELGELEAVKKSSVNAVKQFLSERSDHYRASYARTAKTIPRRCIFAGTTNEDNPLIDHTGDRRFWPVEVRNIDIDAVIADRNQLWAEAVAWYQAGKAARETDRNVCIWWLDTREKVLAKTVQAANRLQDDWEHSVAEIVARKPWTTVHQILLEMGITARTAGTSDSARVGRCLKALAWKQYLEPEGKVWRRTERAAPQVSGGLTVVPKTA